jgi:hypothetical protein
LFSVKKVFLARACDGPEKERAPHRKAGSIAKLTEAHKRDREACAQAALNVQFGAELNNIRCTLKMRFRVLARAMAVPKLESRVQLRLTVVFPAPLFSGYLIQRVRENSSI